MGNGAWEQVPNVLCAFLHTEVTSIAWSLAFKRLQIPSDTILPISGMPYDHGRNEAVKALLANPQFEYLFFIDTDIIAPPDTVLRLLRHNQPIVSGVYCRRSPPIGIPVMLKNFQWIQEYPANSLIEVDMVGTGCVLIHRSVFESLAPSRPDSGKLWFDWRVDMKGLGKFPDERCTSEDFVFCLNARDHGYKILVDTSIQCKHVGYSQVTHNRIEALDANPIG